MKNLRAGVIGCGNISVMHLTSIKMLEQAELICVCDIKEDRAKTTAEKYDCLYFTDYKEMISSQKLDAVHICLPHYLHTPVAQYVLEHGVNVISEKPMSIAYSDAADTVELAKKCELKYGVIFQCRYNTASQFVKKHIENGNLGKVKCARTTLTWHRPDSYYTLSDWKGTWDKEGGGVIIDQAIHSLDLANWFINDTPVSVDAALSNRNHTIIKVEDSAEGLIKYKNGSILGFWAMNNYGCDEPIEIRLLCENGTATLSYENATIVLNDGMTISANQDDDGILDKKLGKDYWGFSHIKQIKQFYNSIIGTEKLEVSGEEALKIQKIICSIYESGKMGKLIDFS